MAGNVQPNGKGAGIKGCVVGRECKFARQGERPSVEYEFYLKLSAATERLPSEWINHDVQIKFLRTQLLVLCGFWFFFLI